MTWDFPLCMQKWILERFRLWHSKIELPFEKSKKSQTSDPGYDIVADGKAWAFYSFWCYGQTDGTTDARERPIHWSTNSELEIRPVKAHSTKARPRASVELEFVLQWIDSWHLFILQLIIFHLAMKWEVIKVFFYWLQIFQ